MDSDLYGRADGWSAGVEMIGGKCDVMIGEPVVRRRRGGW